MPPPENIKLGTFTRVILDGAVWREKDQFPAHQAWADEFERVLVFLNAQGQFGRFQNRLQSGERDGALAEARAGFYFNRSGFRIIAWEPVAAPGKPPGDIEIVWRDTEAVFVEVKCPGWEGELGIEERAGRTKRPKHISAEARFIDPIERVIYVVGKALPKFDPGRANLVVVVDDLFVSPLDVSSTILSGRLGRELVDTRYSTVSGVFLLNPVVYRAEVEYRAFLVPGIGKPLPDPVKSAFLDENTHHKTPT